MATSFEWDLLYIALKGVSKDGHLTVHQKGGGHS